jgi:sarcosine oxidase subunit gamma
MVEVAERRPAMILQAAGWPEDRAALHAALAAWLGEPPPELGWAGTRGVRTVMAVAPGRWLLLADMAVPPPDAAPLVVTDLSAARRVLRLTGPNLEAVLRRGVGFDPDACAFPAGRVAQTLIHHVPVLLHRIDAATVDLYVPQSWAHAVREWVADGVVGVTGR